MFFEVCLLSFGLFAGSELYKKIESSFEGKPHNCGLRKKQEQPVSSAEIREQAEVSAALESLTQEVAELRKDFADYLAANNEDSVGRQEVPPLASKRRPAPGSSIFDKLIEENVTLRKG